VSLLVTNIGELLTNDDALGRAARRRARGRGRPGRLGRAGAAAPAADTALDAAGAAALPGFVDSHAHLVFAGDRAAEFAARMAGEPYTGGGIRTTVAATRAASDDELRATVGRLVREALRQGTTTIEIKSGYGLTVPDEARSLRIAGESPARPRSSARTVPGTGDSYVELVCGEMLAACRPYAKWVDVFCERGAFDGEQSRAVLSPAARPAWACGCTPTSSGRAGCPARRRAGGGVGRPLHPPHRRRRRGAGRVRHRRHAAARRRVLHPVAVPGRAPPARRRRHGRARDRLQPGQLVHVVDAVLHRPRRPRDAHDAGRSGGAATAAGPGRCAATTSATWASGARADLILLDAPSYLHLAYRPGVPLVSTVLHNGVPS
jgi:imidazolonepropionase